VSRLLIAVLLALALAVSLAPAAPAASGADRSWTPIGLEQDLMCPVCKTRLDMSQSAAANQIRDFLTKAKRENLTRQQVIDRLVASYGPSVLADTPKHGFGLLAWVAPAVVLVGGALAATLVARRWAARRPPTGPLLAVADGPPDERARLERRLDAELERFDE
jgi:cytochrome c-type biogenesis protein CcmH/NrfF